VKDLPSHLRQLLSQILEFNLSDLDSAELMAITPRYLLIG